MESCRRDLLDQIIALHKRHLKQLLNQYVLPSRRTHVGFAKQTPAARTACTHSGRIASHHDWQGCTIAAIGPLELTQRPAKGRSINASFIYRGIYGGAVGVIWRLGRGILSFIRAPYSTFARGKNEIEVFLERMSFWAKDRERGSNGQPVDPRRTKLQSAFLVAFRVRVGSQRVHPQAWGWRDYPCQLLSAAESRTGARSGCGLSETDLRQTTRKAASSGTER